VKVRRTLQLAAGGFLAMAPLAAAKAGPSRIVSLDYCADQFVLGLADRERILAVSPDAGKSFSYMRAAAAGLPRVRPRAEDVLLLDPDLVVRSYGGGPNARSFLSRAGVAMAQIGTAETLDGVKQVLRDAAAALGESARAESIVAAMEEREAALRRRPGVETVLYLTPSGITAGPGTLVHEMLRAAGFRNFQVEPGWRTLPLERLAYERPDRVAAAFFSGDTSLLEAWSAMRHPLARAQLRELPVTSLPGAWTACGGWFLMDAVEALATGE
jgi:iron complex transport system substrate-binding protein